MDCIQRMMYSKYEQNKDWFLVLLSQLFAILMNSMAKFLQTEGSSTVHPLQIIGVRMSLTVLASTFYLTWRKIQSEPSLRSFPIKQSYRSGQHALRALLTIRGVAGAFGVIGFYCKY